MNVVRARRPSRRRDIGTSSRRWSLWERGAEAGDGLAMNLLGAFWLETDPKVARAWFERAAVAGNSEAMANAGASAIWVLSSRRRG